VLKLLLMLVPKINCVFKKPILISYSFQNIPINRTVSDVTQPVRRREPGGALPNQERSIHGKLI